jgi:hypothetical protein
MKEDLRTEVIVSVVGCFKSDSVGRYEAGKLEERLTLDVRADDVSLRRCWLQEMIRDG